MTLRDPSKIQTLGRTWRAVVQTVSLLPNSDINPRSINGDGLVRGPNYGTSIAAGGAPLRISCLFYYR
jgi:hypothetical protein